MKKAIYISIKPKFTKKIEAGEKNYEFRKYIPKEKIDTLFVYETAPTCKLKYIIELGDIVEYPNKLLKKGYGNDDFNNGLKESKFAYEIIHVDILANPIELCDLKNKYGFVPPQSYAYDDKYKVLTKHIIESNKVRLI